ncbi:hypothetical protein AT705_10570 [Pseudoalteromonas rubra]|uniref:Uncharacterized protein n=1 Tax=Pseudoalteromonas rubra TaxID=43658 RepID=A0A0U2XZE1_9GAMM|nr:hypothetical protein AT705_10570 [Pseudoalteromonas rubra]
MSIIFRVDLLGGYGLIIEKEHNRALSARARYSFFQKSSDMLKTVSLLVVIINVVIIITAGAG